MSALLGDTVQKAMIAKVIKDMVTDVADNKRAYGNTLAVGTINNEVVDKLTKMGKASHHSIITVRDDDILHGLRDIKQGKSNSLPVDFWQQLPDKLQNLSAILLDPKNDSSKKTSLDTLIFVYKTEQGKVMIKLDYDVKMKTKKGKERVKLNMVTTGGMLFDNELKDNLNKYELLWGKL